MSFIRLAGSFIVKQMGDIEISRKRGVSSLRFVKRAYSWTILLWVVYVRLCNINGLWI
ncbi:hypothetical protein DSUL_160051 [Desulfovibrionales bacterium]